MPRKQPNTRVIRSFYAGPTLLDAAKAPYHLGWAFLLAWVFCVFYLQVFGIPSGEVLIASGIASSGLALFFDSFPVFTSVATLITVIAVERRIGPPSAHPHIEIASSAAVALGTPLLLLNTGEVGTTALVFGVASLLTGIGSGVMWISWGEHYVRIPQEDVELFAPISAVLSAFLTLAVSAMSGWVSAAVVTSFPLLSGLCLFIARKESEPSNENPKQAIRNNEASMARALAIPSSMGRTIAGILIACLFVCVAGALVEGRNSFGSAGIQAALVASIVFTLAIASASIVGPRRISISFFYRWMCPALVLGFAAVVLFGEQMGSYLAFTMSVAARFAFCLITQMYFARIASEDRMTAVQAYGWGWISVHLGDFLGVLATAGFAGVIAGGTISLEQVAVASMAALVVATMFVIDDKRSFASPHHEGDANDAAEKEMPVAASIRIASKGERMPSEDEPEALGDNRMSNSNTSVSLANPFESNTPVNGAQTLSVKQRIESIAREYGLTPRELEVFALLARGRSIPYVRDALVISRETAATHAKHIYAKLGVHSRQELIDLVADVRTD